MIASLVRRRTIEYILLVLTAITKSSHPNILIEKISSPGPVTL